MAMRGSQAYSSSPRDLEIHMQKLEVEAVALRLIRRACCAVGFGTLAGAAVVLVLASSCCRRAVLHVDFWTWVSAAIITLSYVCCMCQQSDQESYHPLTWDEERAAIGEPEEGGCVPLLKGGLADDGASHFERTLGGGQLVSEGTGTAAIAPGLVEGLLPTPPVLADSHPSPASTSPEAEVQPEDVSRPPPRLLSDAEVQADLPLNPGPPPACVQQVQVVDLPADEEEAQGGCGCVPMRPPVLDPARLPSAPRRMLGQGSRQLFSPERLDGPASFLCWRRGPVLRAPAGEAPPAGPPAEDVEEAPAAPARVQGVGLHSAPTPEDPRGEEAGAEGAEGSLMGQRVRGKEPSAGSEPVEQPQVLPVELPGLHMEEDQDVQAGPAAPGGAPPAAQAHQPQQDQADEGGPKAEAPRRSCCCRCCCACCAVLGVLLAAGAAAVTRYRPDLIARLEDESPDDLRRQAGSVAAELRKDLDKEVGKRFGPQPVRAAVQKSMPLHWHIGEWGICDTECGTGRSTRLVYCVNGNSSQCKRFGKAPPSSRPCRDVKGCKWHLGKWGECDSVCGPGRVSRNVSCLTGKDCHRLVEKPLTQTTCEQTTGCEWDVQPWEACSNSCGHGKASRIVSCKNGPLESCLKHSDPPAIEKPCHSYSGCRWREDEWAPCSNVCGSGTQRRSISCAHGASVEDCQKKERSPRLVRACHDTTGCNWSLTDWSACSTDCGVGTQTRHASCADGSLVDCLAHSPMPPTTQSCSVYRGCKWVVAPWGYCYSACGSGLRRRAISCANATVDDCRLGPEAEPDETKPCYNVSLCGWSPGRWSPCSNVCGEGRRYRVVHCGNGWEKDCRKKEAPPAAQQDCKDTSGCLRLQGRDGCECFATEPVMLLAGTLDAVSGWSVSVAAMHKLVSLVPAAGHPQLGAGALLSVPAVLMASWGALAAALVLQAPALLPDVITAREAVDEGPSGRRTVVTPGFVGLSLWLLALLGLCCMGWSHQRRPRCSLLLVALSFCGMALVMAFCVPPWKGGLGPLELAEVAARAALRKLLRDHAGG
mmetsp:Transcript_114479/g.365022  ORF Transcript_114479/g.365022 Transcript_114479/m.365022 type:complete len:1044 (+) Transcript_114479:65-3196(+)